MSGSNTGQNNVRTSLPDAMNAGTIDFPPFVALTHSILRSEDVTSGVTIFSFFPQEFHYNLIGTVHGGVITAMLDSAMGCSPAIACWKRA